MLRISKEPQTKSEQEHSAQLAESRKNTAEGEFIILSENKKKLEKDVVDLQSEISANKILVEKTKQDIVVVQNNHQESIKLFESHKAELGHLYIGILDVKRDLELFKKESELVKEKISSDVEKFISSKNKEVEEKNKEIEVLDSSKKGLESNIKDAKVILDNQSKANEDSSIVLEGLEKKITSLLFQETNLKSSIERIKSDIKELNSDYLKYREEVNSIVKDLSDKKEESTTLDIEIEKKKKEYKEVESKSFVITQKQDLLNQKEAFIKSRYERAGIKYED
jgi:chromosome segregation ATPase